MLKRCLLGWLLGCLFVSGCHSQKSTLRQRPVTHPKREFRGVWIATVDNVDWPIRGDYNTDSQQRTLLEILNHHQQTGINAIFFQVRDAADAYYSRGATEPWSEWLTGKQGKAPYPFYDPTEFAIQEAHARGMEFHAWLNLNRAVFKNHPNVTPDHISRNRPDWMLAYDGMKIFNVGIPEVRNYITGIVTNLVRNYDIDGIHFDDYFYPYKVPNQTLQDQATFRKYGGGFANIDDWRRGNINQLIKQIADSISAIKPYVKFGISPFGVWRNKSTAVPDGSETKGGQTSYDDLYADTRKWVALGWIDYIAPQVYFHQKHKLVAYQPLVNWWRNNHYDRHLYIGQGTYRLASKSEDWRSTAELTEQLIFNRKAPEITGSIHFSSKSLTQNIKNIADTLRQGLYRLPALVPTMPWKDNVPPLSPNLRMTLQGREVLLQWAAPRPATDGGTPQRYVVYKFEADEVMNFQNPACILRIVDASQTTLTDSPSTGKWRYAITALDRLHNESTPSETVEATVR